MGLNIGIYVKKQLEEYMSYGSNPKGNSEAVEEELWTFLLAKFPNAQETFGVHVSVPERVGGLYDFGIRFTHYASQFEQAGYSMGAMYLALCEFVLDHFSENYGINMEVYYSG